MITRLSIWQTLTLALLFTGYAGYYLCRSNLSVTLPMIVADLSHNPDEARAAQIRLGGIASLGVLAYAIGKFPAGGIADFLGGQRNFLLGMGGTILFTVLFAYGGSLGPVLAIAWAGNRFMQSLGWAGMVKIVSRWFSSRRYGTVMAIVSCSYLFGDALARRFMSLLIVAGFTWRQIFLIDAGVLGAIFLISLLLFRETPLDIGEAEPAANPDNLFGKEGEQSNPPGIAALLKPLFRSPVFWIVCALSLGATLVRETFGLWTPTFFVQAAGFSQAEAADRSALFPLLGGVSVILCGWMSDRLGPRSRAAIIFTGLALSGVTLLCLAFGAFLNTPEWKVTLVSLVAFLLIGPYSFLAGAISLDFGGKQGSATASGVIDGIGYLGGVLAGDTMGRVSLAFGWTGAFAVLAAVSFFASGAAALFLVQISRRAQ